MTDSPSTPPPSDRPADSPVEQPAKRGIRPVVVLALAGALVAVALIVVAAVMLTGNGETPPGGPDTPSGNDPCCPPVTAGGSDPALAEARGRLEQLGYALRIYGIQHNGKFPPSLEALKAEPSTPENLNLRSAGEGDQSLEYITGLNDKTPPTTILAYDPATYKDGRAVALLANGRVEVFASAAALQERLAPSEPAAKAKPPTQPAPPPATKPSPPPKAPAKPLPPATQKAPATRPAA